MTRLEWLKRRQQGLGGSDIPSIMGIGWNNPADVYYSKVNEVADRPPTGPQRLGLEMEPIIGKLYAETMGVEAVPFGYEVVQSKDHPFLFCTPDFRAGDVIVQGKTTAGFSDEWGPSGSDQVPADYRAQIIHEMGVCGTELVELAALCRITGEFRVYRLAYDADAFAQIVELASRFWELVSRRTPPPGDWLEKARPARTRVIVKGKKATLADDVGLLVEQRKQMQEVEKRAKQESDRLKLEIEAAMGDCEEAVAGDYKLKWVHVAESTYTTTRKASSYVRATKLTERAIRERDEAREQVGGGAAVLGQAD